MDFLLTFDRLSSDSELLPQFMIQKQLKEKRRDVANMGQPVAIFVANAGQHGCLNANLPYWAYWANQAYWAYWPIRESACSLVIFA